MTTPCLIVATPSAAEAVQHRCLRHRRDGTTRADGRRERSAKEVSQDEVDAKYLLGSCVAVCASANAADAQTATIEGRVVDARSNQPLARVVVHVEDQSVFAETDATGAFTLSLPPGRHTISASLIGYAIVRHDVDVGVGATQELVIELSEGAGRYEEVVTVAGSARDDTDGAPGGSVLHGRDLQALRGVMLDDPLRALQALPSATSTNDFFSEFAVRGSSFRHLGLAIDGIPAPYLIHSIHEVPDGGSIAMVNSEAL